MSRPLLVALPARFALPTIDRWQSLAGVTFGLAVVVPIVAALIAALWTSPAGSAASSTQALLRATAGSSVTAAASTALALAFGVPLGEAIRRSGRTPASVLLLGALLPLAVPSVVFALGIRALLEAGGGALGTVGAAIESTMAVVLSQSCVTIAIVAVAWHGLRPPGASGAARERDDVARVLGLGEVARWRMVEQPEATRALAIGALLAFLHAFTSLAAPLIFPLAGLASLPLAVHRGSEEGAAGLAALMPLLITLPVLTLALRARPVGVPSASYPETPLRHRRNSIWWPAIAGLIVIMWVLTPLVAVVVRGFTPEAVGSLLRGDGGLKLWPTVGGSFVLACSALLGGIAAATYAPPSVPRWLRTGRAPWLLLTLPSVSMMAVAAEWSDPGAWWGSAVAVHAALGYTAALPALSPLFATTPDTAQSARVLGADGLQRMLWGDRQALRRAVIAAALLAIVASLGDVATTQGSAGAARTLSGAVPVLAAGELSSAGAYAVGSLLMVLGGCGAAFLARQQGAAAAIWGSR